MSSYHAERGRTFELVRANKRTRLGVVGDPRVLAA